MANPLKMLKLKTQSIQMIHEIRVAAAPGQVWSTLLEPTSWFQFDPDPAKHSRQQLELRPGGQWTVQYPSGSATIFGTVVYFEPEKLLRISGQLGLTHLPVNGVMIFELQSKDGKSTLLRVGIRMLGYMDAGVKKRYQVGWKQLMGNIKNRAEA